jgi:DNA-binding NarL/FixJ family response regulator
MTHILIATAEPVLAMGFESILAEAGFDSRAICTDVVQVMECLERSRPDVAILDLRMPPGTGLIDDLRRLAPQCQVVLCRRKFSVGESEAIVRAGVRGILPADVSPRQFVEVIRLIAAFPTAHPSPAAAVINVCDDVERQLINLVGRGMPIDEIACVMHVEQSTVERLLKDVLLRHGVQDRYELALYGISMTKEMPQDPNLQRENYSWKNEIATA